MARYIVLRLESNSSAETLLKKFEGVPAIDVVGVFASATTFCPGKLVCGEDRKLIRSRRYGTLHCSVCKLVTSSLAQSPRNLLNDPDLNPRFVDLRLSVYEPYAPPEERYGEVVIDRKKQQVDQGKNRIKRYKAKKRRDERERNEQSS